jgi:hypothetical protein
VAVNSVGTQAPAPTRQRAIISRLVPLVRPIFGLLVLSAIGYAIHSEWSGVHSALRTLAWQSVFASFLAACAGTATSLMAWRALLADEGHHLGIFAAGQVFLVGQLGKYLPGNVWSVVAQVELGKRVGVPRARSFTASLVWVGLSLSTALCVGLLGLPVLASAHSGEGWALIAILPFAVVASTPKVLTRLVNLVLRGLRKPLLPKPLSMRAVLSACGWLALTWIFFGLHLWLLANALGAPGLGGIARCVGGFALAMAAGVLFVFVPSGAGVREALIVTALLPVMSAGEALGIALVSRALFIITDVVSAGGAALATIRQVENADVAPTPT